MSINVFGDISMQTGVTDMLLIEKTFYECDSDMFKTIFKLMGMDTPVQRHENVRRTLFDDLRDICDEKDAIFHDFLAKQKAEG